MRDDTFFCLQVLLTKTEIRVTHFPSTISPTEKLRDVKALYKELLAPTGAVQRSETISDQEIDEGTGSEEDQSKHAFAKEFPAYARQTGIDAMCLLMRDRQSIIFISAAHPDVASQHRDDMLFALRRTYPVLDLAQHSETSALLHGKKINIWFVSRLFNRFYVGNAALMTTLHERLEQQRVVTLNGMGGMGKSELAMEYLKAYQNQYASIIWFDGSSHRSLQDDLSTMTAVSPQFCNALWKNTEGTLLILDNVHDMGIVRHLVSLEKWQGQILLTTRFQQFAFASLVMPLLTVEEGTLLVLRRGRIISEQGNLGEASDAVKQDAIAIAEMFNGFPLALDQVGAYVEGAGVSLRGYLSAYQQQPRETLGVRDYMRTSKPEASLVEVVEETMRSLSQRSRKVLLKFISRSSGSIEWKNLQKEVLEDLMRVFLVQEVDGQLSMHCLVQTIIQDTRRS